MKKSSSSRKKPSEVFLDLKKIDLVMRSATGVYGLPPLVVHITTHHIAKAPSLIRARGLLHREEWNGNAPP
jgi:hypothetical protein